MKFKKLKKLISKTDYVRIVVDDVDDGEYLSSEFLPDKYDDYQVVGFEHAHHILVGDHKDLSGDGVEVVLRKKKKKGKELKKNNDASSKIKETTSNEFRDKNKKRKEKLVKKISEVEKEETENSNNEE